MSYSDKIKSLYQIQLGEIRNAGIYKEERFIHSSQAADIEVEFPKGADLKNVINMCANNYLGLSSHPEVIKAAHEGLERRGYGMSSVRFICGTQDIHRELENKVTEFLKTEDTILFPSCMDANAGVFEAILTSEDVMISDRLVHASIIDGMRLCSAQHDTFKHSGMEHLEEKLQLHSDKRIKLVITDGVFSMDGDIAKLDEMVKLCEKYNALIFVDDSHSSGFIGKTDILSGSTERRDKLEKNAAYWRKGMTEAGFILREGVSPIVPVMLFNAKLSQDFSRDLYDEGIYAIGFFFPVVPNGQARIRTQISAGHEISHLDKALAAFIKVGKKYGILGLTKEEIVAKYGL